MAGQQRTSMTWENLPEVQAALAKSLKNVEDSTRDTAHAIARDARDRAKQLVPVDTGALKRSITMQTDDERTLVVGVISANTDYAAYVEYGTSRMAAQPYMRPAMLEAERAWNARAAGRVTW